MPLTGGIPTASELLAQERDDWLEAWSAFASGLTLVDIPEPVVTHAKLVLLDTIGAMAAGSEEAEIKALNARPGRDGPCAAVGGGFRNAETAALINGTAGTMLEIDEGNQYARGHPGIQVIPAALATAVCEGRSGAELLTAIILGYEFGARIGMASVLEPAMHPHGTWGAPAAALSVAKLKGLDPEGLASTVNIGSSLSLATSRRTMIEGATVRNAYTGFANSMGVMAAELQAAGLTGETDGIATVFGTVSAKDFSPQVMLEQLGTRWEIARNYFKRHAACRYTHSALDALDIIRQSAGRPLVPVEIEAIEVDTYIWAAQLDRAKPDNMLAAKFSLPFALATAIKAGGTTLAAFREPNLSDPENFDLSRRVIVREDTGMTAQLPDKRPSQVKIRFADGAVLEAGTLTNRGDAESPYSADEVCEKYVEVATPVFGGVRAQEIKNSVLTINEASDVLALNAMLANLPD